MPSWDQPIYTQPEGGVLGLVAPRDAGSGVEFLLHAKAEPGNIGVLQIWSDHSEHMVEYQARACRQAAADAGGAHRQTGVRIVYRAEHNEEGGRFWRKSNENIIVFVDDERVIETT